MFRAWAAHGLRLPGTLYQVRWAGKKRKAVSLKRPSRKTMESLEEQMYQETSIPQPEIPISVASKLEDKVISEIKKTSSQKQKEVMDFFFDGKPEKEEGEIQPPKLSEEENKKIDEEVEEWIRNKQNPNSELPPLTEEDLKEMKAFSRIKVAKRKKKKKNTMPLPAAEPEPEAEAEALKVIKMKKKRRLRRTAKIARTSEIKQTVMSKTDRKTLEAAADPSIKPMVPHGMMKRSRNALADAEEEEENEGLPQRETLSQSDVLSMIEDDVDTRLEAEGIQTKERESLPQDNITDTDDINAPYLRTRMIPKQGTSNYEGINYRNPTYKDKKEYGECYDRLPNEITTHKYIDNKEKIVITGSNFNPNNFNFNINTWVDVAQNNFQIGEDFVERIISYCETEGFPGLTITQRYALPMVCAGHSCMVHAPTGTGKSMAFIIPAVITALRQRAIPGTVQKMTCPTTLIIVGNPLLQEQTKNSFLNFSQRLFKVGCLNTEELGESFDRILKKRGCDVLIATPNQLRRIIRGSRNIINFAYLKHVVIDEPDQVTRKHDLLFKHLRSLIDNHIRQLKDSSSITKLIPKGVEQVTTWSASCSVLTKTLIRSVHNILVSNNNQSTLGNELLTIDISTHLLNPDINHRILAVSERSMKDVAFSMFNRGDIKLSSKTLVICVNPEAVHSLASSLGDLFKGKGSGADVLMLTGQMDHKTKNKNFSTFQNGGSELVMISTDVASRGLQFDGLDVVLLVGLPRTVDDWVHSVGRVGRGGRSGTAISLVSTGRVTTLPAILAKLKATHLIDPIWTAHRKSRTYTNLAREYTELEAIPGEVGLVVKKLDISPEIMTLADRIATAMSLGSFSSTVTRADDASILDPKHPSVPQRTNFQERTARNRIKRKNVVSMFRGTFKKTVQRLLGSGSDMQGTWAKPYSGSNRSLVPDVVMRAHQREEDSHRDQLEAYRQKRKRHQQQYRSVQIDQWRSRAGDHAESRQFFEPDVLHYKAPTATSTFYHHGTKVCSLHFVIFTYFN